MKYIIKLLVLVTLGIMIGLMGYTNNQSVQPTPPLCLNTLQYHIDKAPYCIYEYEVDVFDCSNMAALLHDHLERYNYDVCIIVGYCPTNGTAHAWLKVMTGRMTFVWVEPTWKEIMCQDLVNYVDTNFPVQTIYDSQYCLKVYDYEAISRTWYCEWGYSRQIGVMIIIPYEG